MHPLNCRQGRAYANQSSYTVPPRFRQQPPISYLSYGSNVKVSSDTPFHIPKPIYRISLDALQPQLQPASPVTKLASPYNTPPMSTTSTSSSTTALIRELQPGPLKSLFYDNAIKPLPAGSTLNVLRCRPCVHSCDPCHSIWTANYTERETMRASAPYLPCQKAFASRYAASSFLRNQGLDDLRHRLIREVTTSGRVGNPSLSATIKNIEEATASRRIVNSACITILGMFVTELIRDSSPRYSPDEVVPYITYWVELKARNDEKQRNERRRTGLQNRLSSDSVESKQVVRINVFSPLKTILMHKIMSVWEPANKEKSEKRFLTCQEYQEATYRLASGLPMEGKTADLLLRTVKGIDALRLFALLLDSGCVSGVDVGVIGLSLAKDCVHDGYSFALYELFNAAGNKICRVGSEELACEAMDIATTVMRRNKFKFEDLEFYVQTCHTVECYRLAQRKKYIRGAPKDGSVDGRPRRKEVQRKEDIRPFLPKYAALLTVH